MSVFIGADPAGLDRLAEHLRNGAEQLEQVRARLGSLLFDSGWDGPDAETFRENWVGDEGPRLATVAQVLLQLSDRIAANSRQQTETSAADTGTSQGTSASRLGGDDNSLHDYLLSRYQVSVDPRGMVMYPDGVTGWLLERAGHEPQRMTKGEAEALDDIGLAGLKDAYDCYKTAINSAENIYGGAGLTDGHSDAFRHAYWNAMLTNRFGAEWTENYTTAHERVDTNAATAEAMDLHNNEVGRRIAEQHPDAGPEELKQLVDQAVRNGEMVVVGPDGKLHRSNEIPMGETGRATDPPGQGGPDPKPQDPYQDNTSGGYNPGSDGDNYGTYDN